MKEPSPVSAIIAAIIILCCFTSHSFSQAGNALDFDGTNDYVEVPDSSSLDLTTNYTIEAWIKPESFSSRDGIVSKYQSASSDGYFLRLHPDSPYTGLTFDGMNTSTGILEADTWYHIAAVNDNGTRKLYLNGVEQTLTGTPLTVLANTDPLCFGVDSLSSGRYFDGVIEEVRIWDTIRDSVQIRENMYLPLTGTETDLISYWQFNNGTGTTLSDIAGGNHGTLTNMDEYDWITSDIPFGAGQSNTQTETAGTVDFTGTGLSMDFNTQTGAEITVTRIDTIPNINPDEPETVFDAQYWVVDRFGTGGFDADLTFTLNEDLTTEDESRPFRISLYTRGSNADTSWGFLTSATSIDAATNTATFEGLTGFSQFIIAKAGGGEITLLGSPDVFTLVTDNFNSIDVGTQSTPGFTDLDSDGLTDLIIGEYSGNLNHYEQDAADTTSFSLVTENFSSIDVGYSSAPSFTDLDGDGLLDLIIGEYNGKLNHYEQDALNSTSFSLLTNNFNDIDVGSRSKPSFTDLDGNGLLDLIIGETSGHLNHYEQDALNSTTFLLLTEYFNSIDVGSRSAPIFTDFNGNGLLDMVIGEDDGNLNHYGQDAINSASFSLITENFNFIDVGDRSVPVFTDFDGNGLDLVIGKTTGNLCYFEQESIDTLSFGNVLTANTAIKNYYLKAGDLTSDLNIECPESFKVSLSESAGFVRNLSISPVNNRINDTIYLRFEPGLLMEYNSNIVHSSIGAETKKIALNGTGVESTDAFPGTALDFDGTDDYVEVPDSDSLDLTNSLTIEAWIKAASWKTNAWDGNIVSKQGNVSGYMLRCGDNGKVDFTIGTGAWSFLRTDEPDSLSLNTWYHIAATYDGIIQKIYINGLLVKEGAASGDVLSNANSLMIGTSPEDTTKTFAGKIEELQIWNIARDSVQIRENMYLPLSITETGLISYWQFNDGTDTTLLDTIGGNHGTLTNMDENNWITSTIPFGAGVSITQTETAGTVDFTNTGLSMYYNSQNVAEVTVTRIDTVPNIWPAGPETVFDDQYWVVNRYGTANFDADLTFTLNEDLTTEDESDPFRISLYTRESNADTSWGFLTSATSVDASTDEATFEGVMGFSQFIIGKTAEPEIVLLKSPDFTLITTNFNSIDIGHHSMPSFTDIDGDGLLDMVIGEHDGNLNHYEQDAINSASFSLVTGNFGSIDIGSSSTPSFTDLDGNGLLDMIIGEYDGNLNHYEQAAVNSGSFSLVTGNFNSINIGNHSAPAFTDIDDNGLLDLIIGEYDNNLNHYEQDAVNSTSFSLVTGNFNSINIGNHSAPAFTDIDGDGLLDLIIGELDGNLNHFEQDIINSTSFSLITENFNSIDVGVCSAPAFTDIDSNSLPDLIIGELDGNLNHYKQESIDTLSFGNVLAGNGALRNYYLKAGDLLSNLNIECPEGYKVSLSESAGFVQNLSITPVNQRVSDMVYLRFEPDSIKGYIGNIVHSSVEAETKNITVSGTGVGSTDAFPGTALDFDGANDYVSIPSDASLNTAQFTVEFWVATNNPGIFRVMLDKGRDSNSDWYFLTGNTGQTEGVIYGVGDGTAIKETAYSWNDSLWHHVAGTYDGTTLKLFVDGQERDSDTYSFSNTTNNIVFGSRRNQGWPFEGKLDEVRIWNIALDSTCIRENMYLPLDGTETGLIGYWQFNDETGTTLSDIIKGNHGTLTNMDEEDWVTSTIPFGAGYSNTQTETAGTVDYTGTGLSMDYNTQSSAEITVTRIDTVPNISPTGADTVFDAQYWVVNRYGSGSFDADLTFALKEDLTSEDESSLIGLYTRTSTSDMNWAYLRSASSVDTLNDKATFDGITGFSQFIIMKMLDLDISLDTDTLDFGSVLGGDSLSLTVNIANAGPDTLLISDISTSHYYFSVDTNNLVIPPDTNFNLTVTFTPALKVELIRTLTITSNDPDEPEVEVKLIGKGIVPEIVLLESPDNFTFITDYFNSIDIEYNLAPTFTDIDGNGLLDMIIGEYYGKLYHYEQDTVNSTSFSLVTENFNSIDVGNYSAPSFTDIDGDDLLDMIIGEADGNLNHCEQDAINSTSFSLVTGNFSSINVGNYSVPSFTDLDADGLLDMIIGEYNGNLNHYEQDAVNSTSFSLITGNFSSIDVGMLSRPSFTDLDGDGLLDMIIGESYGNLNHYEQDTANSNSFSLVTENFNSIDVGLYSTPSFTDLDGDGLLDLIIGEWDGNLNHYEQDGVDTLSFGNVLAGNTAHKNYYLKADDLISDLYVECPEGYKVSLSDSAGFIQSLSISPVNQRISDTVYLRFEPDSTKEYSGNIVHSSNGAETKNIAVSGTVVVADAFPGTALDFDGTDDYVEVSDNTSLDLTDSLTIEAWIKAASWKTNAWDGNIVSKQGDVSGYMLRCGDNGKLDFTIGTGAWSALRTDEPDSLSLNTWYHVAATYNGATQKIYINGVLIKEGATSGDVLANDNSLMIGTSPHGLSSTFAGKIEEVGIWNIALDSAQIRENMYQTLTGHETGLIGYWQFNDGTGTTLLDIVGGHSGTLTNMDEEDWVNSTAPLPFVTIGDGNWESNSIWATGQNAPTHPWSRVMIKHNITLNSNMEVIEMIIDTNAIMTISTGDTLTVGGE